ncbi:uncharacterized protein IL334_006598 [Kwoniella shivajii]|uniref:Uncharacterized protein n=1 Tax=Kwoniella shivajii TaxID=564305 RepID=A0ABZ1D6E7_9TREE|nr:hypothetical protein IL334_006598 [Kwoniella shivajii]
MSGGFRNDTSSTVTTCTLKDGDGRALRTIANNVQSAGRTTTRTKAMRNYLESLSEGIVPSTGENNSFMSRALNRIKCPEYIIPSENDIWKIGKSKKKEESATLSINVLRRIRGDREIGITQMESNKTRTEIAHFHETLRQQDEALPGTDTDEALPQTDTGNSLMTLQDSTPSRYESKAHENEISRTDWASSMRATSNKQQR